jgi:hypothetical protein
MDRTTAIRIDGMLRGSTASLDGIAHYMKNNLSSEEYAELIKSIGYAMGALFDVSQALYARFPEITPKELIPPDN